MPREQDLQSDFAPLLMVPVPARNILEPVNLVGASAIPTGTAPPTTLGTLHERSRKKHSFVAAVREEQRRVLSKLCWDETPLEVEGAAYPFYSRDLLLTVMGMIQNAAHVLLWGEQLGMGPDGTCLRSEIMDSDLFLSEEATVRR